MRTQHRNAAQAKRRHQADPFAIYKVVARNTGFNQAEQVQCALPVRLAWDSLRNGSANAEDIGTLTEVIAICLFAAERMDALIQETCEAAASAMCAVVDRFTRIKRWGVDANALRDIPPVIDFYEELLKNATGAQMELWLSAVAKSKAKLT